MTPQQILDAIAASPELQTLAVARNDAAIAASLSVGRTKLVPTEIGVGTILEILGLSVGNALIDAINNTADFRHIRPLLEQGRLRLDAALVQGTLQSLVPTLLTQAQASALANYARKPDPVPVSSVSAALNGEF